MSRCVKLLTNGEYRVTAWNTFHKPSAAAHFAPPDPMTSATRFGCLSASLPMLSGRRLEQAAQIGQLRLRRAFSLGDDVRELPGVEQADFSLKLR